MKQLVLGKEGLAFLQSFLNDGNYLGAELSAVLCGTGEVLTWLPDELDLADVSFRDGWRHEAPPVEDIWRPLLDMTREFLARDSTHIAVAESSTVRAEDLPDWTRSHGFFDNVSYFICDGSRHRLYDTETRVEHANVVSVFSFLNGTQTTAHQVSELIRSAFPFHEIYVLTSLPEGRVIETGTNVEREYLRRLASRAEFIAVGAYDGSGVILWTRRVLS